MRHVLSALLLTAALVSPGAAQADHSPLVPLSEVFDAFKAICLANPDNTESQIAAAKAPPYGFEFKSIREDGSQRLDGANLAGSFHNDGKRRHCLVVGRVAPGTLADEAVQLIQSAIDPTVEINYVNAAEGKTI